MHPSPQRLGLDRRTLLKSSLAAATTASLARGAWAHGSDTIRVGVIGCGGRGTGAAANCAESADGVVITAMGDLFPDRLESSRGHLAEIGAAYQVDDAHAFSGFDAVDKVLACDIDLAILTTPPHFRPAHLAKAVAARKHVFMEKPVAVDPAGVRSVIESARAAKAAELAIVAGTQRRHQAPYLEVIERIQDGAIGDVVGMSCYWNQGGLWMHPRKPEWSDMEWQMRNWLYFTWLSGDHICEQHIHNIDVMNWVAGATPLKATGMGGREVRTDAAYGNVFDHFAIEFEYPQGVLGHSFCRQIDGTPPKVGEHIVGTQGRSNPGSWIRGKSDFHFDRESTNPYVQEHADLIASIRAAEPLNEARRVAESTLTAIMGRMSTYTGQSITWEQALNSKLDLTPSEYAMGTLPVAPVSVPGETPFV